MPLRIGFDMDGVLADMDAEMMNQAEVVFGEAMVTRLRERAEELDDSPADGEPSLANLPPPGKLHLSSRQQSRLWRHIATVENFWEGLQIIEPGVIRRLADLAVARRWEIIFLTKRPETAGFTAQVQTQRWLQANGFPLPSVYVVQGSRGRIAAAIGLDIVIDDRPENCLDVVADSKARAILVWREAEAQLPAAARRLGIGVVKSVSVCLDILVEIDSPAEQTPGMLDRVKRMLGLKQPDSVKS